ncbi:MAG: GlxA family transcriptional regulator, partial [Hyphomicrobiales bacterium]
DPASASNGLTMQPQIPLEQAGDNATIIVCAGIDPHLNTPRSLAGELRRRARRGADIGSLCTGSYVLARAGLLAGYRCTIHWENLHTFEEAFPDTKPSEKLFEIDANRFTCAGGAAAMDMMLALISEQHGVELAGAVAEQIVHSPVRSPGEIQRPSYGARIGMRHPKLARVLQQMEARIENPVSSSQLARETGLSTRQLERLFSRYLGRSPKRYYLELRLKQARNFLLQTEMPVIEVAIACGFTSASHFSKCYRGYFATTPFRERTVPARKA